MRITTRTFNQFKEKRTFREFIPIFRWKYHMKSISRYRFFDPIILQQPDPNKIKYPCKIFDTTIYGKLKKIKFGNVKNIL